MHKKYVRTKGRLTEQAYATHHYIREISLNLNIEQEINLPTIRKSFNF